MEREIELSKLGEKDIQNFVSFIKKKAGNYSWKLQNSDFDYNYFVGEGFKCLAICLKKFFEKADDDPNCYFAYRRAKKIEIRMAKNLDTSKRCKMMSTHPLLRSIAFSKYFRTSLFRQFNNIIRMANSAKHRRWWVSRIENEFLPSDGGFKEIEYQELIEYVAENIENVVERQIFILTVNPPEELCELAILDNTRRMKIGMIRKLDGSSSGSKWGRDKVRISERNMIDFMGMQGVNISRDAYDQKLNNVKKRVVELLQNKAGEI